MFSPRSNVQGRVKFEDENENEDEDEPGTIILTVLGFACWYAGEDIAARRPNLLRPLPFDIAEDAWQAPRKWV